MNEALKVYGGMLALGTFTAQELSRFSNVKLSSVHTVLRRIESSLEKVSVEPTNRRGGQPMRRRLRVEAIPAIREKISTIAQSVSPLSLTVGSTSTPAELDTRATEAAASSTTPTTADIPLAVRIADDVINRLLPEATDDRERLQLLAAAELQLRGSHAEKIIDPAERMRFSSEVTARLQRIAEYRREYSSPLPGPPLAEVFAEAREPVTIQLWQGMPAAAPTIDTLKKQIEKAIDVLVTPVPKQSLEPPLGDGVILFVDSSQPGAKNAFSRARKLCRVADKPLLVFDRLYDPNFRNLVLNEGIEYVPDAQTLDQTGTMNIIANVLNKPMVAPKSTPRISVRDILPAHARQIGSPARATAVKAKKPIGL